MRLLAQQRSRPEDIGQIRVRGHGTTIPMSLVVNQKEVAVLQSTNRVDRERAIGISGNVAPGYSQAEAMSQISELAKEPQYWVDLRYQHY